MHLILFGFKGVGKTTLGKKISLHTQKDFVDTDELIQREHPTQTIPQIYQKLGESAFRLLEQKVIMELHLEKETIIALGGGAPFNPTSLEHLQTLGIMIYLTSQKQDCTLYHARLPLYKAIPSITIDVDTMTFSQILRRIHGK